MPKIMIAAGIFHPESGGPATYLKEILPALQNKSWQATVLSYGDDSQYSYPYPVTRIKRQILPLRLFNYWQASAKIAQSADLIYAHTIDLPVQWHNAPRIIKIVGDQAWERCIRRGWITATTDIDDFQTTSYSWLVNRQKKSRSEQVRAFDAVIVPSHYLKQMVMAWGVPEQHIHVIYNALPPEVENLPTTQASARALLNWDDRPTILTAARLTPWKGVDHLINAIKKLDTVSKKINLQSNYFIYGENEFNNINEQIAINVDKAKIWRDTTLIEMRDLKKDDYLLSVSYDEKYANFPANNLKRLLKKLPKVIPVDEVYFKTKKIKDKLALLQNYQAKSLPFPNVL